MTDPKKPKPYDEPRFRVPAEVSAQVHTHAMLAAKLLHSLELYSDGYTSMMHSLGDETERPVSVELAEARARRSQIFDRLAATRRDLIDLAVDALATGTENLRKLRMSVEPDIQLMAPPDPSDPVALTTSMYVIRDRLKREARDASDQLGRLIGVLDGVADPAVLTLSNQLQRLATGLRPPDMPPGPYARQGT